MIISVIRRAILPDYNLEETNHEVELRKGYELIYNTDDYRYELFRLTKLGAVRSDDLLEWQMSCPHTGKSITSGMRVWLQKYDTSEGGKLDDYDRKKNWAAQFKRIRERDADKAHKDRLERIYCMGGNARRVQRYLENQKQVVVPAGAPVGETVQGVKIRPWKGLNND